MILFENDEVRIFQRGEKYYFTFTNSTLNRENEISQKRAYEMIEMWKSTIYKIQGLLILRRGDKYFARFERGEVASREMEIEISKEDADKLIEDDNYLRQIIKDYDRKRMGQI